MVFIICFGFCIDVNLFIRFIDKVLLGFLFFRVNFILGFFILVLFSWFFFLSGIIGYVGGYLGYSVLLLVLVGGGLRFIYFVG